MNGLNSFSLRSLNEGYNSFSLRSLNEGYNLSDASDIKLGGSTINALYYGSTLIWPRDYAKEYLTIEANSYGETITIRFTKNNTNISRSIQYSKDKINWATISFNTSDNPTQIELNPSEKIYLKGTNSSYSEASDSGLNICRIIVDGNAGAKIYGNIMSLIYGDNFYGQTVLTSEYTFTYLFSKPLSANYFPSNITDASNLILPATTLTKRCYDSMFSHCSALYGAPKILPATTLAYKCYSCMFESCAGLITPPELPATTLAYECYYKMFAGCTNMRTTPELPATTLTFGCYREMFSACEWINAAPELPATTLTEYCYYGMFEYCYKITTAPELPATNLENQCYFRMFYECSKLNYIKCLAINNIGDWYRGTEDWTYKVASTGTFIKSASATDWKTGTSGIPSGWTVQDA